MAFFDGGNFFGRLFLGGFHMEEGGPLRYGDKIFQKIQKVGPFLNPEKFFLFF